MSIRWSQRITRLRALVFRLSNDEAVPSWARDECKWALEDDEKHWSTRSEDQRPEPGSQCADLGGEQLFSGNDDL